MKQETRRYKAQLAVIGSGLAGFAASIFALKRGIATAQIGNTGSVAYTSGYFDLLGVCDGKVLENPWAGLDALRRTEPNHPLSRISADDIRTAFVEFTDALSRMGLEYTRPGEQNLMAFLPGGITKPTLSIPTTMLPGIAAVKAGKRGLIIDFKGLQGFSAREMVANLKTSWPHLEAHTLAFPDMENGAQLYPEVMARALEVPQTHKRLADLIKGQLGDSQVVGLPAILGVHNSNAVHAEMEKLIGVPVFEIPTMPPAVPGIRLRELFEKSLPSDDLLLIPQHKANRIDLNDDGVVLYLQDSFGEVVIEAQAAILSTGRFLSGGLAADRDKIWETLVGIDVRQPDSRDDWHRQDYFDPRGHPINRSGIEVDEFFRPLSAAGEPVSERLFAAGVLLAHQDWVRQRCGAGIALASAYKAVEAASKKLNALR